MTAQQNRGRMKFPTLTGWIVILLCDVIFYGAAYLAVRWIVGAM